MRRRRSPYRTWRRAVVLLGAVVLVPLVSPPPAAAATWRAVDTIVGSGLRASTETYGAHPVDYDGDGDQDVLIGYHDQGAKLWRNNGNRTYTRVAVGAWPKYDAGSGKVPDRHECDWADVDLDGRPDAYCATGRSQANHVKTGKDNELWLQLTPGRFTELGTEWGVGDLCGRSHSVAFLDANGDAYPDLFVGNVAPREVADPCDDPANGLTDEFSKLFINEGGTGFRYAPEFGVGGYGGDRCAEVADVDGDGWDDLLACGPPGMQLWHNDGGTGFTDVAGTQGLTTDYTDAVFGDLDRDGDPDLVTARADQFGYRLNTAGTFGPEVRIGAVPVGGNGRSVAVGDADGDGDLDVYGLVSNLEAGTNPNDRIYRNAGLRFTAVPVPVAAGIGDAVTALDADGNGRAEFLVLNGVETNGPIQRIELVFR